MQRDYSGDMMTSVVHGTKTLTPLRRPVPWPSCGNLKKQQVKEILLELRQNNVKLILSNHSPIFLKWPTLMFDFVSLIRVSTDKQS